MDEEFKVILQDHEKRISHLESLMEANRPLPSKRLSIKEFLLTVGADDDVVKTLCVAYYLERFQGLGSFTAKDIEAAFRAAKEPVPDNINYKVIKNIEKGFIMEAESKRDHRKAWNLTTSGEKHVESRAGKR